MIYIIDFGSSKTPDIVSVVTKLNYDCVVVPWKESQLIDLKKAKGFILSGAPVLLTETSPEPYIKKYSFLKEATIPVLGICFGHQLIGLLYEAKIFKGEPVRKAIAISVTKADKLFNGLPEQLLFTEDHTEGISLPEGYIQLARSEKYEVEAMKHSAKNIYGVQFHPEISESNGSKLIENFLALAK